MDKILLVEDNQEIGGIIRYYLEKEYDVTYIQSAEDALLLTDHIRFDAILLDVMLPNMDGITLCQQLRKNIYCPIIFISCLGDEETIIRALKMGGDDYLVKPFKGPLLIAHIEANLRRSRMLREEKEIRVRDIILDQEMHAVFRNGQEVLLSPLEYEILYYLMQHKGKLISFKELYSEVWHQSSIGDVRTIFVHIHNLRKKIEPDPDNPQYLKTVRHDGYVFVKE
ncbi:response regulator transcription factor [Desulfitobacterium sp. THU1]